MTRKIVHCDLDYFYAQVEIRDNPELAGKPVAVGYDGPRSVISTANYIARQYGVGSAMPVATAKKRCPELILVRSRMDVYREISQQIREIFFEYTEKVQFLSLDEAFLDLSECKQCQGSATYIAIEIRKKIYEKTGLTASCGIAPNKFLAKIASDLNKPNGQYVIPPSHVFSFVEKLKLRKIPGIGPKTAQKYKEFGVETCEDVRNLSPKMLKMIAGNFSETLLNLSNGIDNREVEPDRERKSVSVETTFSVDLDNFQDCFNEIKNLIPRLEQRMSRFKEKVIAKQGIKLKFTDFSQTTVECQSPTIDLDVYKDLLEKGFNKRGNLKIRLIGISIGFVPDAKVEKEKQIKKVKQFTLDI